MDPMVTTIHPGIWRLKDLPHLIYGCIWFSTLFFYMDIWFFFAHEKCWNSLDISPSGHIVREWFGSPITSEMHSILVLFPLSEGDWIRTAKIYNEKSLRSQRCLGSVAWVCWTCHGVFYGLSMAIIRLCLEYNLWNIKYKHITIWWEDSWWFLFQAWTNWPSNRIVWETDIASWMLFDITHISLLSRWMDTIACWGESFLYPSSRQLPVEIEMHPFSRDLSFSKQKEWEKSVIMHYDVSWCIIILPNEIQGIIKCHHTQA